MFDKIEIYTKQFKLWLLSLPSWFSVEKDRFKRNFKYWGWEYGIEAFLASLLIKLAHRYSDKWKANNFQHSIIEHLLIKRGYWNTMQNALNTEKNVENVSFEDYPIWVCWWQGENSMPEIVKVCYKRMLDYNKSRVHLITFDNYKEYVDIPQCIFDKIGNNGFKLAHLSDLLRLKLLAKYGGLWIDSTIYLTGEVPISCFGHEFFSIKNSPFFNDTITKYRWTSFILGSMPNSGYMSALALAMERYLVEENVIVHYLLIDYFIDILYRKNDKFRFLVDNIQCTNPNLHTLRTHQNEPYNADMFEKMLNDTMFFKMSYRENAIKIIDGQQTYYGHILCNI